MIAAVHDCQQYGLDLYLYLKTEDLQTKIAAEYQVRDPYSG